MTSFATVANGKSRNMLILSHNRLRADRIVRLIAAVLPASAGLSVVAQGLPLHAAEQAADGRAHSGTCAAACEEVEFTGVTERVFENLKKKLEAEGLPVPEGTSGSITGNGYILDFSWDEDGSTLTIRCIEKPWWAPCRAVYKKIREFIEESTQE